MGRARSEIYGRPGEAQVITLTDRNPSQTYDEGRVAHMKDALLEALKAASNIRELKPDDAITVCVFGPGTATMTVRVRPTPGAVHTPYPTNPYSTAGTGRGASQPVPPPAPVPVLGDLPQAGSFFVSDRMGNPQSPGTTMTLSVKKSDADAFAKDKLSLDEFRKRAKIAIYASGAD